jgi:DNA gyrase subunit A
MGIKAAATKEEDYIERVEIVNSHDMVMFFSNKGKVFVRKAYQIPEGSRTAKGTNIVNLLELEEGEMITASIAVSEFAADRYLTMITRGGVIKRTALSEYEYQRKGGKRALNLDEGDELAFVFNTDGKEHIMIATRGGYANRFREEDIRESGRVSRGVRGIRLKDGDFVTGAAIVEEGKTLITLTENGYGKRTEFENFNTKGRGGVGVHVQKITDKTGPLVGIASVGEDEDLMIVTNQAVIIRTPVNGINIYGKDALGVIIMRVKDDARIVSFSTVAHEEVTEEVVAEEE